MNYTQHFYVTRMQARLGASRAWLLSFAALLILSVLLAPASLAQIQDVAETDDDFGDAVATGDFNGDGRDDLAVGVPGEDDARGVVQVIYGTSDGLTTTDNQLWRLNLGGAGDQYGRSLATGDFNGDGYDDLAIGAPGADPNGVSNAGIVGIIYGTAQGLVNAGSQAWDESDYGDIIEADDGIGRSLAAGDFDGDGFSDLAIGEPFESLGSVAFAGEVTILYGTTSGLSAARVQFWDQSQLGGTPESNDEFGWSLAAGDFDGDSRDDLAIGAFREAIGDAVEAGEVSIIYGADSGLQDGGFQNWSQSNLIAGPPESFDRFGFSLAVGDFNGDADDDLAIGAPGEDDFQGRLHVIYGGSDGLTDASNNWWWQGDISGTDPNDFDIFGSSLASGNFDGDAYDDLAVGAPNEDRSGISNMGEVDIFYGGSDGIQAARSTWYIQGLLGGEGGSEVNDLFGQALAAGDFNADGAADLAIGVPFEDIGSATNGGAVNVVFGQSGTGLNIGFNQFFYQGVGIFTVDAEDDLPASGRFALTNAYPNPFSEATTLRFELPTAGTTRLAVYDVLGREVSVLHDGIQSAGEHEATFDAAGLPSGMYIVRLTAGKTTITRRVTVVR